MGERVGCDAVGRVACVERDATWVARVGDVTPVGVARVEAWRPWVWLACRMWQPMGVARVEM